MHPRDYRPLDRQNWIVTSTAGLLAIACGTSLAITLRPRLESLVPTSVIPWAIGIAAAGLLMAMLWWVFVAIRNVRVLNPTRGRSPLGATCLWIVPVVNLIAPPLTMRTIWRSGSIDPEDGTGNLVVTGWWLLVLAALAAQTMMTLVGQGVVEATAPWSTIRDVLAILATCATGVFVHVHGYRQNRRHTMITGMPSFGLRDDHVSIVESLLPKDAA